MKMKLLKRVLPFTTYSEHRTHLRPKQILTVASILYLISNIGWLLVHGVFWDDWVLYENPVGIEQMLSENGGSWTIPFHFFLLKVSYQINMDVALLYKLIILLLGWVDLLFFYSILKQLGFNSVFVFCSTILFASWPLGYSHFLMVCIVYQIGVFFQLVVLLIFVRVLYIKKRMNYINILLLFLLLLFQFFASFCLPSTIVFWFGFLCVMTSFETTKDCDFSLNYLFLWIKKAFSYLIFFVPCLVYWGLRIVYFLPTGGYLKDNYNTITLNYIIQAPVNSIKALLNTVSFIFYQFSFIFSSSLYFFVFITIFIILLSSLKQKHLLFRKIKTSVVVSFFFLFFCAIAAYILVGKVPAFDHVNDRFGVLLALVAPPILVSLFRCVFNTAAYKLVFVFSSIFCTYSLSQSLEGIRLSHRNDAIIEFFKKNKIPSGNIRVVEESTKLVSNFYSWAGLYYKATGCQDRCFECSDVGGLYDNTEFLKEMYHMKDAHLGSPTIIIYFINKGNSTSYIATIKRLFLYFTNKGRYKQVLLDDFRISWGEVV